MRDAGDAVLVPGGYTVRARGVEERVQAVGCREKERGHRRDRDRDTSLTPPSTTAQQKEAMALSAAPPSNIPTPLKRCG